MRWVSTRMPLRLLLRWSASDTVPPAGCLLFLISPRNCHGDARRFAHIFYWCEVYIAFARQPTASISMIIGKLAYTEMHIYLLDFRWWAATAYHCHALMLLNILLRIDWWAAFTNDYDLRYLLINFCERFKVLILRRLFKAGDLIYFGAEKEYIAAEADFDWCRLVILSRLKMRLRDFDCIRFHSNDTPVRAASLLMMRKVSYIFLRESYATSHLMPSLYYTDISNLLLSVYDYN